MRKRVLPTIIALGVGLFIFALFGFHGGAETEKGFILASWTLHERLSMAIASVIVIWAVLEYRSNFRTQPNSQRRIRADSPKSRSVWPRQTFIKHWPYQRFRARTVSQIGYPQLAPPSEATGGGVLGWISHGEAPPTSPRLSPCSVSWTRYGGFTRRRRKSERR